MYEYAGMCGWRIKTTAVSHHTHTSNSPLNNCIPLVITNAWHHKLQFPCSSDKLQC